MMREAPDVVATRNGRCVRAAIAEPARDFQRTYATGVRALVAMREGLLAGGQSDPPSTVSGEDLRPLLSAVFSPDILELRAIDWASSSPVLDHVVHHEAVHEIVDRDELRRRLHPEDRRCFGLFHPAMPDHPVIFTEIALTSGSISAMSEILAMDRAPLRADAATTAVFYSISDAQPGLRGIPFGHLLIARAVRALSRTLPGLHEFVTLSPLPLFRRWLTDVAVPRRASEKLQKSLPDFQARAPDADAPFTGEELRNAAEAYLLHARREDGRPVDPVARFHLGNGASLDRVHLAADLSPRGTQQSFGVMATYRYERQNP